MTSYTFTYILLSEDEIKSTDVGDNLSGSQSGMHEMPGNELYWTGPLTASWSVSHQV